jgi:predicted nucleic acid-binding protein
VKTVILLDSSLIVAYSNEVDENHAKAKKVVDDVAKEKYGTPVITDYVFDEVVTVMLVRTKSLARVTKLGETLLGATQLVRIDEDLFGAAWVIFKQQRKNKFSFTDCTSIAVCKANGISNVATLDEDFAELDNVSAIGP